MAAAWAKAWGKSWGASWGLQAAQTQRPTSRTDFSNPGGARVRAELLKRRKRRHHDDELFAVGLL